MLATKKILSKRQNDYVWLMSTWTENNRCLRTSVLSISPLHVTILNDKICCQKPSRIRRVMRVWRVQRKALSVFRDCERNINHLCSSISEGLWTNHSLQLTLPLGWPYHYCHDLHQTIFRFIWLPIFLEMHISKFFPYLHFCFYFGFILSFGPIEVLMQIWCVL